MKTKPTQHAVRSLNSVGLHPDMIIARAHIPLDEKRKEKIEFMCSLEKGDVISAPNAESIYQVPLNFEADHMSDRILSKLSLDPPRKDLKEWRKFVARVQGAKRSVKIGIVGKYFGSGDFVLEDSYISVLESVKHAAAHWGVRPDIHWVNSEEFEKNPRAVQELKKYDGVIVPGGFGARGVEGKIAAIKYLREKKIPFFGLCYGMQLATIEYARHVAGLKGANTTEIDEGAAHKVIDIMPEQKVLLAERKYGASMRLGAYPAELKAGTVARKAYGKATVSERHRHRFEVNPDYIERLESAGFVFSGSSPDRRLMEIAELPKKVHPFFLGTQFHPEFKSRPLHPHPLFKEFIAAAMGRGR